MDRDGIRIERESCRAYVNMEQSCGVWKLQAQDPQLHVYFEKETKGVRLKFLLRLKDAEYFKAALYYKGAGEEFSEERVYTFSLFLNQEMEKEIYFPYPVEAIRLDLAEETVTVEIDKLEMVPVDSENGFQVLRENLGELNGTERTVLITHDMNQSGAPILAYHIAQNLKRRGQDVVVLAARHGNGFLEEKFTQENIPVLYLHDSTRNRVSVGWCGTNGKMKNLSEEEYLEALTWVLRDAGFVHAITNTVVAGQYVRLLKEYGFQIISLIHEMKATIELYGFLKAGAEIARYSDYIVFPDVSVRAGFEELYPSIEGECAVRPQGVYMQIDEPEKESYLFEEYGIPQDQKIVMCSGTCELRKGTDLFVAAASILHRTEEEVQFVWAGGFQDPILEGWMHDQICKSNLAQNFHFIPFIQDKRKYHALLSRADVFWLTSREDPFPSVVLEAMKYGIPVVAFENSGGVNTMLARGRGNLIPDFDVHQMAMTTKELFAHRRTRQPEEAKAWIETELKFDDYITYLQELLQKEKKVRTEFDLYAMTMPRQYEYFGGGLSSEMTKQRIRQMQSIRPSKRWKGAEESLVFLDTSVGSNRTTDKMIVGECRKVCSGLFQDRPFLCMPTSHPGDDMGVLKEGRKILCGANILSGQMEKAGILSFSETLTEHQNICLMGAGIREFQTGDPISSYTKSLLQFLLCGRMLHSVRDEKTKHFLEQAGIQNVVRTGCPSLWSLTAEQCEKIPKKKGRDVLTALENRGGSLEDDRNLLRMLKEEYETVYIWIRDRANLEYLRSLTDLREYTLIPGTIQALQETLNLESVDYIGTHIQAGIQSLTMLHRSLIISDMDYAQALRNEMHLPVLKRSMQREAEAWLSAPYETQILLPQENIKQWKAQFIRRLNRWYKKK